MLCHAAVYFADLAGVHIRPHPAGHLRTPLQPTSVALVPGKIQSTLPAAGADLLGRHRRPVLRPRPHGQLPRRLRRFR